MAAVKGRRTAHAWKEKLNLDEAPDAELMALLEESSDEAVGEATNHLAGGIAEPWTVNQIKEVVAGAVLEHTVGELLRRARHNSRLTLADVGARLGVSKGRVSQLEKANVNLELKTLARTAAALGYDLVVGLKPRSDGEPLFAELKP